MEWIDCKYGKQPNAFPHEAVDTSAVKDRTIWRKCAGKRPLYVMWTTGFDCLEETNFWYCIKDTPFDMSALKSKRRHEIYKGLKSFDTRLLQGEEFDTYADSLYEVYKESLQGYAKGRVSLQSEESFKNWLHGHMTEERSRFFMVTDKESGAVCGYADLYENGCYVPISSFKTCVSREKDNVNFALVYGILSYYEEKLQAGEVYISDGARNLRHETHFQDFLERYFGFRKAYCCLHVVFWPPFRVVVRIAFLFRRLFKRLDHINAFHNINTILKLETLRRENKKKDKKKA